MSGARRTGAEALTVTLGERILVAAFPDGARVASWAIVRGGIVDADRVAWVEVRDDELGPTVDARAFLAARLSREGIHGAVGLLTSRRLSSHVDVSAHESGVGARAIVTVGLGNALRAGDPPSRGVAVGTINVLVYVDTPLTDEGLLEANAIATEAKAAALFDAGIASRRTGRPATGTGTDCTVAACPRAARGVRSAYSGKHTPAGAAVGVAVNRAVATGVRGWQSDSGLAELPALARRATEPRS